ncbi:GPI-anchored CFEM domain protein [Sphaceloma murrayae]|uniref:GPI-anchored CFEM domain protein n=1 Tax=Sphaceloma murrayae TaxID=2082308 RepID=A0A2K1QRK0_9PEZI|nr:GPI-anchored CFEM domain protein [Sphaceloma murrayae]
MRSLAIALAALATTATAQRVSFPGLPSCAGTCVTSDFGGCGPLDIKCICSNKSLIDGLACCVSTTCNAQEQGNVISFANSFCGSYSVSDLPQAATCAPGAASTPTAAASASTTATGSSASVTATTTGASSSAAATTGTNAAASTSSSSSSSSSPSSSAAAASPSATGSANKIEAAAFGVAALVFGALAAM